MKDLTKDLHAREFSSKEKFDYFICGVSGALFAYIGQTYTPHKLDYWFYFLTPVALLVLTLSFAAGLKRIQTVNQFIKLNRMSMRDYEDSINITEALEKGHTSYIDASGKSMSRQELAISRELSQEFMNDADKKMESLETKANAYGNARDVFLIIGFVLILGSKILQPYEVDMKNTPKANEPPKVKILQQVPPSLVNSTNKP